MVGAEEISPQIALAMERFRAIDLSCLACDACGAGAGCWAWIPGGGLRSAPFSTPNLRLFAKLWRSNPWPPRCHASEHIFLFSGTCCERVSQVTMNDRGQLNPRSHPRLYRQRRFGCVHALKSNRNTLPRFKSQQDQASKNSRIVI